MSRPIIACCLMMIAGSAAAQPAAKLSGIKGSVLVNQGKQFVSAESGQMLVFGDRVMVMEGGSAKLDYSNGCVQILPAGSLSLVQETCSDASVTRLSALNAQAVGDDRDCDKDGVPDSQDEDKCPVNTAIWVAGGLVAVGLIFAVSGGGDDNNNTVSP